MAITKTKMAAVTAVVIILAFAAGIAVVSLWPASAKPEAAAPVTAREAAPSPVVATEPETPTFETVYALKEGDAIRRVMPPFIETRLDFYRNANPSQAEAIPRGPEGMLVVWKNGKPSPWGMTFGGRGYQFGQLIEYYLKVFGPEIEGDAALRRIELPGDFVIRENATVEEYRTALEKIISEASGATVRLTFRDVERPVYVLKGKWQYVRLQALKDQPQRGEQIEIYGRDLNDNMRYGGGGAGTTAELAGWISRWIDKQVMVEATDTPERVGWHLNSDGDGSPESRGKSKNPELVIKHIEDQTGLAASLDTRKVKRLFVEAGK